MTGMEDLLRFDDVDATADQRTFIDFLDRVDALPDVSAYRARSYEAFAAAGCVVDVGCGTGTAARELASRVDRVVGVDASQAMIEVARIRSGERPDLRFVVGDALSLPLDDASVDGYGAERLFQHLADHAAALSEARRVLRPRGRIAVIDQDWDTLIFASEDVGTARRVAAAMADSIAGGTGARNLAASLDAAGFTRTEVRGHTTVSRDANVYGFVADLAADAAIAAGVVDRALVERWRADQRTRARDGTWLVSFTFLATTATAP